MTETRQTLPDLPLDAWEPTKITLHLYLQIAGKVRLALSPRKNHWWYAVLHVSPRGFTTGTIPYNDGFDSFEIEFNLVDHRVEVATSRGDLGMIPLRDGLSVPDFYQQLMSLLQDTGIDVHIRDMSYDVPDIEDAPFSALSQHASYDPAAVERFWRAMLWVDGVFREFSGRFYGKTSPVNLYWHHMDLTVTRFSGKMGPPLDPAMRLSDKDAYSHEVVSFGFWAGDPWVRGAAFYSYTYPSPDELDAEPLAPASARWQDSNGSPMAMLMYDDLRQEADPRAALLSFLESAYQAGAKRAGWPIEELTVPPLSEM